MLHVVTLPLTAFQQNTRILYENEGGEAVVIDPGGQADRVLDELKSRNLSCAQIWLTHSHLDHCGGVADLKAATDAKLFGHPDESFMRGAVLEICQAYGIPPGDMKNCPEPDEYIEGGARVSIGDHEFDVLFTPGHSPGHVSFYRAPESLLIAGDTLFAGSIGRSDLPGGNHQVLMSSIREIIMELPDDTRVLSGHGPDTTVGVERVSNPFVIGE